MALDSGEFVRNVMAAVDAHNPGELAEAMRWKRGTERLIAKWLTGETKPGYRYTMEMLEKTGWLTMAETPEGARPLATDDRERIRLLHQQFQEDIRRVLEAAGE